VTPGDEPVNRLERRKQRTRAALIRAAQALIAAGKLNVPVLEITQAADVGMGSFYNHFDSKEQLALAAFDYALERVRQRFADGLAGKAHAADALIAFLGVFRGYAQRPPISGGCPILNTAIESDDTNPILRDRVCAFVEEWRSSIQATVRAGIARGEIRPEVDGAHLALLLIATMEGAVMLTKLLGDPAPLEQAYQHLAHYIQTLVRQP